MTKKKRYYAVRQGSKPGIYDAWSGTGGAEEQVKGVAGARYRGFATRGEAEAWMAGDGVPGPQQTEAAVRTAPPPPLRKNRSGHSAERASTGDDGGPSDGSVVIHTDGGCIGNPGPGGYGAVVAEEAKRMEISGGYRLTTNNRMELMACIAALETLKKPSTVLLHSDSRYVVDGINRGWAKRWRAHNWMRNRTEAALNADLWERLLELCHRHRVRFNWVRGHAGNAENERCDELAVQAARGQDLAIDEAYEGGTRPQQKL